MLAIVFLTILLDFLGFSILIPVLPLYADRLGASPLQVGLIVTLYALAQLFFLPAWGWVSDRFGRRPVILVSLAGTVMSFLVLAAAESIGTIYLARVLGGFFAASIGTAQAVVADVTGVEDRARGMGLIGAAFGLGFAVGPFIGGVLGSIDERLPFQAVALLAALNLLAAWRNLPESHPPPPDPPQWRTLGRTLVPTPLRLLVSRPDRRIALYLYLFLHIFTAFAALESMFALYLGKQFGVGAREAGLVFFWIGLWIALTQGVLVRRLVPQLGEPRLVALGLAATAAGLIALPWVPSYNWLYAVAPVIALGNGLALPPFTSLYSKACEAGQAGELLGHSQAMATTGRVAGPLWAGWVMGNVALGAPFWIAGLLMLLALALFLGFRATLVHVDP